MNKLICSLVSLLFVLPVFGQLRVTQTTTASGNGSPMVTAFSSAPATGDLLVALIGYYSADAVTPPYGWTLLKQQYANGAGGTTGFTSYYHIVAAGENNSYTFDQGGNSATVALYDIVGADVYHPFNSFASKAQTAPTASVMTPSVTPTVLGTLPLAAVADEASQPTGIMTSGWKYTAPASTRHPVGAAFGPLTTSTTSTVATQFSLTNPDFYGVAPFTVLVNPTGTTGHTPIAVMGGPYVGVTGFDISFDGSASSDPRYEALTYAWSFGDRSTGTGMQTAHHYTTPGTYTVTLTVTDADGNTANTTSTATIGNDCSSVSLGNFGALNGFVPSPTDAWHQDISGASVDPMSNTILVTNTTDLAGSHLHPDFGGNGAYGIPYTVVDSSITGSVPLNVTEYPDESDVAAYPIPSDMPVEGSPANCSSTGDNHAIVFDKHSCVVHEMYHTQSCSTSGTKKWSAGASTMWDLTQNEQRPYGITSVDAAGLSVFEGLVRYDEIQAGVINHAIRFTAQFTKNNANNGYFTGAATHSAGVLWGTDNIEGMRIRLKASFDISNLTPQAKIIATAMKKYGMILADNGSNLYFQGTPDLRWDDNDLGNLKGIPASAFEVVNASLSPTYAPGAAPLYPNGPIYDAVNHPTGVAPTVSSFTASSTSITAGQSVTITPTVFGSSYSYIDQVGFVRGAVTVTPTATTTYTLTSRNFYGTSNATVTVNVQAPAVVPSLKLGSIADQTFGAAPFVVSASSNSTGAISYTVTSGPAVMMGNIVTITGVGTVTVQASQSSTSNFAATTTQVSFVVNPAAPTLVFVPVPNQVYGNPSFTVFSTSNSAGGSSYSVTSGPASVSGSTVTLSGTGTVVLKVDQAAAGNYAAASATISFTVTPATPQLTFATIANQTYGVAPFTISAASTSSAPVTYQVLGGPAALTGNTISVTGAGMVTLKASQAATGNYAAASTTSTFTVSASVPTITLVFQASPVAYLAPAPFDVHFALSGAAVPTGSVQIFDGSASVGSFSLRAIVNGDLQGSILTLLTPGQHTMTAVYSGDTNYRASQSASVTITVAPRPVRVSLPCTVGGTLSLNTPRMCALAAEEAGTK